MLGDNDNPWDIRRYGGYGRGVQVIEDESRIESWKKHAEKLKSSFKQAIAQRDEARAECEEAYDQRDAWKETCVEVVKTRVPNMTKEQVLNIYDAKKKQVKAKNNA